MAIFPPFEPAVNCYQNIRKMEQRKKIQLNFQIDIHVQGRAYNSEQPADDFISSCQKGIKQAGNYRNNFNNVVTGYFQTIVFLRKEN